MKKYVILIILLMLLVGCNGTASNNGNASEQVSTNSENKVDASNETESDKPEVIPVNEEKDLNKNEQLENKTVNDVVNYLKGEGFLDGDQVKMASEYVGGIEGIKFKSANGNVEIYEMDVNSEEYKSFVEDGYIIMSGIKVTASAINNKFLLLCESNSDKETIVELFNNITELESASVDEKDVTEVDKSVNRKINDVIEFLQGEGFLDGDEVVMAAEYIGGIEGIKFKSANGNVEIYEMDMNSEEYKGFVEDGYIMMSGFKVTASAINDKFLLLCENNSDKETLIELFNSFE